jgi:hypothetical protein
MRCAGQAAYWKPVEGLVTLRGQLGALVTAGESLLAPLRTLGSWLGPAGVAALRLMA